MQLALKNILPKKLRHTRLWRLIHLISGEQLPISMQGLREHKTRSLLTMLGIIFGVAAVIAMLAIGEGARRKSMAQIQALGLHNIIVEAAKETPGGPEKSQRYLSLADEEALAKVLPTVTTTVPLVISEYESHYQNHFADIKLIGTEPAYFDLMNLTLERGGYFSNRDNQLRHRVCVLGAEAAKTFFKLEDPLGKKIKIRDLWFTVVGVLYYQPVSVAGNMEINLNKHVFVPVQTAILRFGETAERDRISQIIVQISDSRYIVSSAAFIEQVLYRRHFETKNYKLIVPEQLLRQSQETQRIFNIVMGAIAGISLLVGGIGIMNIMLASVLERTREIGLRRAVGATQNDIRNQFLIEAILLSLGGGVVGILLGYGLSYSVTLYSEWETVVSLWSVVLAVGVSSIVGILFGLFPAKKAARLDPIEALRYE